MLRYVPKPQLSAIISHGWAVPSPCPLPSWEGSHAHRIVSEHKKSVKWMTASWMIAFWMIASWMIAFWMIASWMNALLGGPLQHCCECKDDCILDDCILDDCIRDTCTPGWPTNLQTHTHNSTWMQQPILHNSTWMQQPILHNTAQSTLQTYTQQFHLDATTHTTQHSPTNTSSLHNLHGCITHISCASMDTLVSNHGIVMKSVMCMHVCCEHEMLHLLTPLHEHRPVHGCPHANSRLVAQVQLHIQAGHLRPFNSSTARLAAALAISL